MGTHAGLYHFSIVAVAANAYPGPAQVQLAFETQGISLLNRGTEVIMYSFDGATDHGRLDPTQPSKALTADRLATRNIWFKRESGAVSNSVDVTAWG